MSGRNVVLYYAWSRPGGAEAPLELLRIVFRRSSRAAGCSTRDLRSSRTYSF
jgi:hypothetical protein